MVIEGKNVSASDRQEIEGHLVSNWELTANLPAGHLQKDVPTTSDGMDGRRLTSGDA